MAGLRRHSEGGSHRGSDGTGPLKLVLAVALIVVGLIFLGLSLGLFSGDILSWTANLWPLLLILVGVGLLLGRGTSWWIGIAVAVAVLLGLVAVGFLNQGRLLGTPTEARTQRFEKSLGSLKAAEVRLTFSAGDMEVKMLPSYSSLLAEARFSYRPGSKEPTTDFREVDGRGILQIVSPEGPRSFAVAGKDEAWDLGLAARVPLDLTVEGGAMKADLDLADSQLRTLRLNVGTSKLDVRLPREAGRTLVSIKAGTSAITLDVPRNVEARIKANLGLASFSIDGERFQKRNGFYMSRNYESAQNKVDLDIDAGVSTVTIR
ncbi:MAG: hypothetical protein HY684_04310 [Chloroflexi bacterium]|nr:hypothetical protein [Chloroflexota bacterium]